MNTALKHWKEAATVILVAGMKRSPAASVPHKSAFNYKVLLLKRSGKSGFMPNAHVFPGGLAEASDFSPEWLDLFEPFRTLPNFGVGLVKQPPETRPPMFATDRLKLGSPVPGDVAFRICAVRETFEEAGVLLVVPRKDAAEHRSRSVPAALSELCDRSEMARWRSLVIQNSSNFIHMCRELQCLPNIWAMHEWGNWLTPIGLHGKQRRYDTAFYLCCLKDIPDTVQDEKEIVHFEWSTPSEVLRSFRDREVWIAPPQFYDLGRMSNFHLLSDLHDFAKSRSVEGCEQWLPVHLAATDCHVSLLPGDSMYPETPDYTGKTKSSLPSEKSLEELQKESPNLHRIVIHDLYTTSAYVNITPKYRHLPPLTSAALNSQSNHDSKL
ncbi:nucleoside diphosphate-linked moiety X motif 19 [Astyanax mexicanus]|uniref:Acyl-coenzyme A diphosphatase NUDT19 n=2 Tax=Astyanax mexicanus TaxID=7994 RepID=W5LMX2_ASTMX|nr:nucleoside diphosphate-linked moiety X motif 19 [Astyanax mexicanus]